jgi:hypothetical protein
MHILRNSVFVLLMCGNLCLVGTGKLGPSKEALDRSPKTIFADTTNWIVTYRVPEGNTWSKPKKKVVAAESEVQAKEVLRQEIPNAQIISVQEMKNG